MLFRSGWVLIGISLVVTLFQSIPAKLFDNPWQLSLISTLLGNGPLILIGAVLVAYSSRREDLDSRSLSQVKLLRTCLSWLSLVLLLLVPIQFIASTNIVKANYFNGTSSMRLLGKVIDNLRGAKSEQEFRDQISKFPDMPPLPQKFELPFQQIRDTAIQSLSARRAAEITQLAKTRDENLQVVIRESFRNAASLVLLSFGFMAVCLSDHSQPNVIKSLAALLERLRVGSLWFASPSRRKAPAINKQWMDKGDTDEHSR